MGVTNKGLSAADEIAEALGVKFGAKAISKDAVFLATHAADDVAETVVRGLDDLIKPGKAFDVVAFRGIMEEAGVILGITDDALIAGAQNAAKMNTIKATEIVSDVAGEAAKSTARTTRTVDEVFKRAQAVREEAAKAADGTQRISTTVEVPTTPSAPMPTPKPRYEVVNPSNEEVRDMALETAKGKTAQWRSNTKSAQKALEDFKTRHQDWETNPDLDATRQVLQDDFDTAKSNYSLYYSIGNAKEQAAEEAAEAAARAAEKAATPAAVKAPAPAPKATASASAPTPTPVEAPKVAPVEAPAPTFSPVSSPSAPTSAAHFEKITLQPKEIDEMTSKNAAVNRTIWEKRASDTEQALTDFDKANPPDTLKYGDADGALAERRAALSENLETAQANQQTFADLHEQIVNNNGQPLGTVHDAVENTSPGISTEPPPSGKKRKEKKPADPAATDPAATDPAVTDPAAEATPVPADPPSPTKASNESAPTYSSPPKKKKEDTPAPKEDKPAPKEDKPAPKGDKPAPEGDKPAPEGDKPAPKGDKPAPKGDPADSTIPKPSWQNLLDNPDKLNVFLDEYIEWYIEKSPHSFRQLNDLDKKQVQAFKDGLTVDFLKYASEHLSDYPRTPSLYSDYVDGRFSLYTDGNFGTSLIAEKRNAQIKAGHKDPDKFWPTAMRTQTRIKQSMMDNAGNLATALAGVGLAVGAYFLGDRLIVTDAEEREAAASQKEALDKLTGGGAENKIPEVDAIDFNDENTVSAARQRLIDRIKSKGASEKATPEAPDAAENGAAETLETREKAIDPKRLLEERRAARGAERDGGRSPN